MWGRGLFFFIFIFFIFLCLTRLHPVSNVTQPPRWHVTPDDFFPRWSRVNTSCRRLNGSFLQCSRPFACCMRVCVCMWVYMFCPTNVYLCVCVCVSLLPLFRTLQNLGFTVQVQCKVRCRSLFLLGGGHSLKLRFYFGHCVCGETVDWWIDRPSVPQLMSHPVNFALYRREILVIKAAFFVCWQKCLMSVRPEFACQLWCCCVVQ